MSEDPATTSGRKRQLNPFIRRIDCQVQGYPKQIHDVYSNKYIYCLISLSLLSVMAVDHGEY